MSDKVDALLPLRKYAESLTLTALYVDCSGRPRAEVIQEWGRKWLGQSRAKGHDVDSPDYVLLWVGLKPCDGHASYRTIDDIPLVNVPCPCGNPKHWLIRYEEVK